MMTRRNLIYLLAEGLAALWLAACSPHEFPVSPASGDPARDFSVSLQFADGLEELRTIQLGTKADAAASDRTRYTVELYRYTGEVSFRVTPDYTYTFTRGAGADLDTTIFLPVDPVRYKVMGWVDWVSAAGDPYYDIDDLEHIFLAEAYAPGAAARDAFFGATDLDLSGFTTAGETVRETVELKRPVAQIVFLAPEALTFLTALGIDADGLSATLRYTTALPDGYNLLRDRTLSSREGAAFTVTPEMDTSGTLVFASDFVFATDEESTVGVDFRVTDASGKVLLSYVGNVPVRRDRRTTLSYTPQTPPDNPDVDKDGDIGISPGFDEEIEVPIG